MEEEYEVNLIDYLHVLWRQKWIIIVTFVAAIVSAYLASTTIKPTYQVKTSLLLLPPLASELGAAAAGSTLSPETYKELALSTTVLDSVLSSTKIPSKMDVWDLRKHISVTATQFGNSDSTSSQILLKVTVSGSDRELLAPLAKEWTTVFSATFGELFQDRTTRSYEYVSKNADSTQKELDAAMAARKELLLQHPLDRLKADLASLQTQYQKDTSNLNGSQISLAADQSYVKEMKSELAAQDKVTVLKRSLDPDTLAVLLHSGISSGEYKNLLSIHVEEEVLNSTYSSLASRIAYTNANIAKTQQQIHGLADAVKKESDKMTALQAEITETEAALQGLDNKVQLLTDANARLAAQLQDAKIALAETPEPIRVIDEPIAPRAPIAPNKKMNIAVAGVLGLMVGVLLAFFVDYLARAKQESQQLTISEDSVKPNSRLRGETDNSQSSPGNEGEL